MTELAEGFHWVDHPTQGTIIIKVKNGLIYQIDTIATRLSNDQQFNKMAHIVAVPHNFSYKEEKGWF